MAAAAPRIDLSCHKKRADKAWTNRSFWDWLYTEAYEFAIPYRRPASKVGKGAQRVERVYDATAIKSAFRSAGQLHQDLFPPNFFKLALGPIGKLQRNEEQRKADTAKLEQITEIVGAFFQSGEFDMATSEACLDLLVGTGVLFPLEGDSANPVRFICIPCDEIAVENDAYGKVNAIFWRTKLTRRQISDAFPKGVFPQDFTNKHNSGWDEEVDLNQDFTLDPKTGRWVFCAYLSNSEEVITADEYRTQPMAVGRYHRVPGEPYGRGPILLALPTIKTLNKAVELTLKAAAIQMLGIWGYRPGGAFNPDTVRLGPGEFWPMQATGGVLGPDVSRLDVSAGRMDVSQLITQELRLQVQGMLGDDSLPDKGATPISASEVMARLKRIEQNYLGAYGRLVNEIVPVVVRRVIEILYRKKLLTIDVEIDQLLIKVDVLSPIASAVKAAAHSRIIDFIQLVVAVKGTPMAADLIVKVDDALRTIGEDQLPASLIRTPAEQKAIEQQMAAAAAQIAAAQNQPQQKAPAA
jgi:hypothetical protein